MMVYYKCYDAHADRSRRWSTTDRRWRVAIGHSKYCVTRSDEVCSALLMHSTGDAVYFFATIFGSLKPVNKTDMPKPCQDALDEFLKGYETTEVT